MKAMSSDSAPINNGITIQPGATVIFPFAVKAPHLLRQLKYDLQFRITYNDPNSNKVVMQSVSNKIFLFPSQFAVPTGGVIGAIVGCLLRVSLIAPQQTTPGKFTITLGGCMLLGLFVALFVARKPDTNKAITVEDFVGGFLIGVVTGMYSESVITKIGTLVK